MPPCLQSHLLNHFSSSELDSIISAYVTPPNHTIYRTTFTKPHATVLNLTKILTDQQLDSVAKPTSLITNTVAVDDGAGGTKDVTYDDTYVDPFKSLLLTTPSPTVPTPLPGQPAVHYTTTPPPLPSTYDIAQDALLSYYTDLSPLPQSKVPLIVCDTICGEAVLRGSNIYAPGIILAAGDIRPGAAVFVYCLLPSPNKPVRGITLKQLTQPLLYLGVGVFKLTKKAEIFSNKKGLAIAMTRLESSGTMPSLNAMGGPDYAGCFYSQNLPSLLPPTALNPQPTDVVLDMCCAPGGKTSHLASLLLANASPDNSPSGFIVCCDRSKSKVSKVKHLMVDQDVQHIVFPITADSTKLHDPSLPPIEPATLFKALTTNTGKAVHPFPSETFTKILLDPPCSALGLRPRLSLKGSTAADVNSFAMYQRGFVHSAIRLLKVDGHLVYSTCTYNPDENEKMVAFILETYPCMRILDVGSAYGKFGLAGCGLDEAARKCVRRFDCSGREDFVSNKGEVERELDSIGFFVAKFEKIEPFKEFDPKEYIASFPAPPSAAPAADVYEARTKIGSSRGNRAQTAKGMINEIIGEQWGGVGGAAQWALVLDGGDCVTTKSMRRNNAAGTILVPQINPGCVGSISAQTGVESWLGRVEDLVMNPPRVLFDLVFLDHCGTLPPRLWQVKKLLESGRMRKPSVLAVTFSSREGRFMDDEWKDCSEVKDSLGAGGVYSQAHCVGSFFAAMSKWAREFGYSVKGLEDERLSSYVMGTSGGEEEVAGVQSALDSGDLWLVAREVLKYFENEEGGRADHARRAAEAVRAAGRVRGAVWTKNTSEDAKSSIRCEFAVGEEKAVGEGETKRLIDCAMDICGGGEISMQRGAEFRGSVKMYPEQMFMACVKLS